MEGDAWRLFIQRKNDRSGFGCVAVESERRVTETIRVIAAIPGQFGHVQIKHALICGVSRQQDGEDLLQTARVWKIKYGPFGAVGAHQNALIKMQGHEVASA